MTDPLRPYVVSGTATNGESSEIVVVNTTTGGWTNGTTDSTGKFILDLANLTNGYSNGDSYYLIISKATLLFERLFAAFEKTTLFQVYEIATMTII